ncbi:MAG TPA: hypothetical protein VHG93_04045 [Longimicrobium sp.]|nr:hypothetical protein [Longimicrobium sp.]
MPERSEPWVVVATFAALWEADFAAETLREAGIPAMVDPGQNVAIFGPGYQGGTQFGVRVRVPWHREQDARDLLEEPADGADESSDPLPEAS